MLIKRYRIRDPNCILNCDEKLGTYFVINASALQAIWVLSEITLVHRTQPSACDVGSVGMKEHVYKS